MYNLHVSLEFEKFTDFPVNGKAADPIMYR